ncbi:MAG: hypothetical protein JXQ93_10630 [Flavobacteriaceae bacterium]
MEIDKNIHEKLDQRKIQPSASAWERLSNQLDTHERRKRRRAFFYISSAASILLLISVFLLSTKSSNELNLPSETEKTIVTAPLNSEAFKKKLDDLIEKNEIILVEDKTPKKEVPSIQVVKKEKQQNRKEASTLKPLEVIAKKEKPKLKQKEKTIITAVAVAKPKSDSRISVDSDALLYAVTHTEAEVIAYYKKYRIDRRDVLNTIKLELKKSNLKINAQTILAEVERDIDDASFKRNFMSIIKKRVSDIATAIASRND